MCGIFGYIGLNNPIEIVLKGLKKLEYRGYDSSGIAGIKDGELLYCKEVGKFDALEKEIVRSGLSLDIAIGHSRWATHGKPSKINAHPQFDSAHSLALVHNGIIENHEALRLGLQKEGVAFVSETDTEVIAQLIASLYDGNILSAVQQAIFRLEGSYALAIIHRDYPGQIIAVAHQSPLAIGVGVHEAFISSDANALSEYTNQVMYLSNSEIAVLKKDEIDLYGASLEKIAKRQEQISVQSGGFSKEGFEHFTLKEIHQQPQTVRNALLSRFLEEYGTATFQEVGLDVHELLSVERILILACGTSLHAGYIGAYMLEDKARIPAQVEISSEFRYKNPIVPHGTFVIAISQSGETADTIAAVREVRAKGAKVLAICNVEGSTLVREADETIFLRAGPEIGVCSTKAFTSQVTLLALFALLMGRMRHLSKQEGQAFIQALIKIPEQIQSILDQSTTIAAIAKKYASYDNFFYIGRRYMFPTSLEAALKLKEISYINANGYAAGEMKHGPIALLNEQCPTVALCCNRVTFDKVMSNLMEVKARGSPIIAICNEEDKQVGAIADDIIYVPQTIDELASITSTVVAQLLAYYIAKERGTDIDQPRNLAKSVTVE